MGLAIANAAKHKTVGLLSEKLKPEGIYVGEVMVLGLIQGTPWDNGNATIPASRVAEQFWQLYRTRSQVTANGFSRAACSASTVGCTEMATAPTPLEHCWTQRMLKSKTKQSASCAQVRSACATRV
jgi:hypothetical protein